MAQYIDIVREGRTEKWLQLDDGTVVPSSVSFSLEGGSLVKLPSAQITALQTPTFPANFPLPTQQVTDLRSVTVGNFPTEFDIGNFPASFSVSNLPATFPLPNGQESILSGIKSFTDSLSKGAGAFDSNTLRTVVARQTPTSISRSSVNGSTSAVVLASANASRTLLRIYNDSTAILYLGLGATNPTSTDFTIKLFQDDYVAFELNEAGLEVRGIWSAATGAARITEGI